MAMCAQKFAGLICRPIAAQFMADDVIALIDFVEGERGIAVVSVRHYWLVPADSVTEADLASYRVQTAPLDP